MPSVFAGIARARRGRTPWLTLVAAVGPPAFALAVVVASLVRPGYDQLSSAISRLGFGENAIVLNVGFLALGAATFSLGAVLRGRVSGRGPAALALAGTSTAGMGALWTAWVLPLVLGGASLPAREPALVGRLHDVLAVTSYLATIVGCLAVGRALAADRSAALYAPYSLATGVAAGAIFAFGILDLYAFGEASPLAALRPWRGLLQRILTALLLLWIEVSAWRVARMSETARSL